ncbi:MAG: DUF2182 domain-containing protein [Pseudomonadota bacterium]
MALRRINETSVSLIIMGTALMSGWGGGLDTSALALLCSNPAAFGPFLSDPLGVFVWILRSTSLPGLVSDWVLMLAVMMPLLLVAPLRYVRRCSSRGSRVAQSCGFIVGYALVWIAAIPLFLAATLFIRSVFADGMALIAVLALAIVWSASPIQRHALNLAHRSPRLALGGWRGFGETLRFGLSHGVLCLCACWAWMLIPMMVGSSGQHTTAMILVSAVLITERIAQNTPAVWRRPVVLDWPAWLRSFSIFRFGLRYG